MPKENFSINKNPTGKFTKKIESVETELTTDQVLNEYIGTIRNEQYLLEELDKTRNRKAALEAAHASIISELDSEYLNVDKSKASSDEVKALEDIKTKIQIYNNIKELKK